MTWYRDAERELSVVAASIQSQRSFQLERIEALALDLVSSLKRNDALVVEALSGPTGSPLITNLINVGILGTKVGIGLGYFGKELGSLAFAGLVHDIGLFAVPKSVITKTGRLTQDERRLIEQHPDLGYELIHRIGKEYHWLAQLTRQVHERINGQGYPNRLKGRQITEMAQILGVVDVFDALVSERPYRRRLLPEDAIAELLTSEWRAFPRELFKALIEQLSVYPLGTTVRLTTGETGTVVKVNSQFPLRPTVKVNEEEMIGGIGPRQVDLSLTPLVSIVETLNPPVIGQVTFVDEPLKKAPSAAPSAASDHFTSLLESLDAIASAIQGVVESSIIASPETQALGNPPGIAGAESDSVEEQSDLTFRKEIVGLFALEAHEWLAQIQTFIQKLGAGVEGPVRSKLYGFILNGITNLAKSASTIQLFEIEEMASNLLPILRDVGEAGQRSRSETLRSFHEGLDRITTAVHRLTREHAENDRAKEEGNDHKVPTREPVGSSQPEHKPLPPSVHMPERFTSNVPLLHALRELQQARARSVQPARDVLETVIDRAEQLVGRHEDQVSTETIERILHDLDRLDEEFFQEVLNRVPAMTEVLRHLRQHGPPGFATASQLAPILTHVEALHELAGTIQSTTIGMFLQGLKSFLTATAYRKVESLPQRLHAVEERLQALTSMAEQWVTLGRIERATISEILPK